MSALNEYLQTFVNDLQPLLNAHQDNEELITAAKAKWPDENDLRRNFVIACQTKVDPLRGKKGLPGLMDTGGGGDDGGRENEPVGVSPLIDTGGDDDGGRENEPVGRR